MSARLRLLLGASKRRKKQGQGTVTGIRAAQAALSTFHTGALQEYRDALEHLDPPRQWAGGERIDDSAGKWSKLKAQASTSQRLARLAVIR